MNGKEVYKIWAPSDNKWTGWVRPVPFIYIDKNPFVNEFYDFKIPKLNYIDKLYKDAAIIVDLPSYESIKKGIALAQIGYRPIPIYNGTNEQYGVLATTNNHSISNALVLGAKILEKLKIEKNNPPVFLLDTNRMIRFKMNETVFDNSWDIYDQDLPSSQYFLKNGISKIIVYSKRIEKDLNKILYNFQKDNIDIYFTNGYQEIKKFKIKKIKYKN